MRALKVGLGIILSSLAWLGRPYPVSAEPTVPASPPSASAPAKSRASADESRPDIVLREAMKLVQAHALTPLEEDQAISGDVQGYLSAVDPYSTYLSQEERRVLEGLDQPDYVGIGLEVIRVPKQGLFCLPFDGGPAQKAGIMSGDRLLAVDGKNVADAAPETLPLLVRGPDGTAVVLTVAGQDGRKRSVKLIRRPVQRPVVESNFNGALSRIRIYRFEAGTKDLVVRGLELDPDRGKIIIDLRGNIGGELKASVATAGLFLPPGSLVTSVIHRSGDEVRLVQHLADRKGGQYNNRRVVIWQDHLTASASEVFIAALAHYDVAITIGRRTFGKGLVQETFPAPDGGLFIITTGEILAPDGLSFNQRGLEPRLPTRNNGDNDLDYYIQTVEAFETALKPSNAHVVNK